MQEPWLDRPELLWQTTRLGREEFIQKLLASLVLGEAARRWNDPRSPSRRGAAFLRALHAASFDGTPDADPIFIDEFELPARHPDEHAGWPDHGVRWPDRLFIIELKTERRSHRSGQLPHYLDLAAHHHPELHLDLLYLTPTMEVGPPAEIPPGARYASTYWPQALVIAQDVWGPSEIDWERTIVEFLANWIDDVEAGAPLPPREAPVPVEPPVEELAAESWLWLAAEVQRDGQQRAGEQPFSDPEELEDLRIELRDQLKAGPVVDGTEITHVSPWLWRAASSGGTALTDLGAETGYELRLSRYRSRQSEHQP